MTRVTTKQLRDALDVVDGRYPKATVKLVQLVVIDDDETEHCVSLDQNDPTLYLPLEAYGLFPEAEDFDTLNLRPC